MPSLSAGCRGSTDCTGCAPALAVTLPQIRKRSQPIRFTIASPRKLFGHRHLSGADGHRRRAIRPVAAEKDQHAAPECRRKTGGAEFLVHRIGFAEFRELTVLVIDE